MKPKFNFGGAFFFVLVLQKCKGTKDGKKNLHKHSCPVETDFADTFYSSYQKEFWLQQKLVEYKGYLIVYKNGFVKVGTCLQMRKII